jgi:hypothetical protein
VDDVYDKLELLKSHHRMRYRLNWEIYDKESGDTFRRERFYEKPREAYAGFDWARKEVRCVSVEIYRRGMPEHPWSMLASFINRPLRAAIGKHGGGESNGS